MALPERFQILSQLGKGGMGVVYLAIDTLLGRQVAIKCVRLPEGADFFQDIVQRLIREAQAAGGLRHPNIVTVYDAFPDTDPPAIVMEYIRGRTLSDLVPAARRMETRILVDVLRQCGGALDYAHSRGIVHRDIKPSNIMLDESEKVFITDFGIAKPLMSEIDLTRGMILGTPDYMSPEQLAGKPLDGKSDQYSLAVMAYRLLTGSKIFEAENTFAYCTMVLNQDPTSARSRLSSIPEEADTVLLRALARDPAKRFPSCSEFVSSLDAALSAPRNDVDSQTAASAELRQAQSEIMGSALPAVSSVKKGRGFGGRALWMIGLPVLLGGAVAGAVIQYEIHRGSIAPQPAAGSTAGATPAAGAPDASPAPVPAPKIDEFSAAPTVIRRGEPVTLHWSVRDASDVSISGVGSDLPMTGSRTVRPETSADYVLEASGGGGTMKRSLTISVTKTPAAAPPAIKAFRVSPAEIQSGDAALLQWDVTGATNISIEGIGPIPAVETSRAVCPTASRSYALTVSGPGGEAHDSVNVKVTVPAGENVKLNRFTVDPADLSRGQSAVLRWEVKNASSVWIDPDIGQVEACGVLRVQPQTTTKYQLSYQNDRGTLHSKPVVVTVR